MEGKGVHWNVGTIEAVLAVLHSKQAARGNPEDPLC